MTETKKTASKQDTRTRNYACVLYPDSAPDNWLDILTEEHISIFVSPLHDRDKNPTGEDKKPHRHIMFMFEGKKSTEQVKEIIARVNGVGCEAVNSVRGYARYLCHLDNPEKAQYNEENVICLGGADYSSVTGLPTDKYKAIREMIAFCEEQSCDSFSDLLLYASEYRFDWFRVLCDNGTVVMKEYLKSKTWTAKAKPENW